MGFVHFQAGRAGASSYPHGPFMLSPLLAPQLPGWWTRGEKSRRAGIFCEPDSGKGMRRTAIGGGRQEAGRQAARLSVMGGGTFVSRLILCRCCWEWALSQGLRKKLLEGIQRKEIDGSVKASSQLQGQRNNQRIHGAAFHLPP